MDAPSGEEARARISTPWRRLATLSGLPAEGTKQYNQEGLAEGLAMRRDLKRRLKQLEARVGAEDHQLRRLAAQLHIDSERLLGAVQGREAELHSHSIDGGIAWEGFLLLAQCMGWNTRPRPDTHAALCGRSGSARE